MRDACRWLGICEADVKQVTFDTVKVHFKPCLESLNTCPLICSIKPSGANSLYPVIITQAFYKLFFLPQRSVFLLQSWFFALHSFCFPSIWQLSRCCSDECIWRELGIIIPCWVAQGNLGCFSVEFCQPSDVFSLTFIPSQHGRTRSWGPVKDQSFQHQKFHGR